MKKTLPARAAAALMLAQVLGQGRSLSTVFAAAEYRTVLRHHAGLIKALCFGVCRRYFTLAPLLDRLLEKPLPDKHRDLRCLALIGLYQLRYSDTPAHAIVSETVAAAAALDKIWAKGLINALLRGMQRRQGELEQSLADDPTFRFAHPGWMIERLRHDWPLQWEAILEANNQQAPMSLRVNQRRLSRDGYVTQLVEAGFAARPCKHSDTGLTLATACEVEALPGFAQGLVSVQDEAAQLAAQLMQAEPGQSILDACAAPGGKTAHLLERYPDCSVTAVEKDADRLRLIQDTLQRLGLLAGARLIQADAGATRLYADGRRFDRILLDAPCSASGVIRRHPDIKVLRRPADIAAAAAEQHRLLQALWSLLEPGGILLYCTCSVLPQENAAQLQQFMQANADAREMSLPSAWGTVQPVGRQILPAEDDMDGFYYACLTKQRA